MFSKFLVVLVAVFGLGASVLAQDARPVKYAVQDFGVEKPSEVIQVLPGKLFIPGAARLTFDLKKAGKELVLGQTQKIEFKEEGLITRDQCTMVTGDAKFTAGNLEVTQINDKQLEVVSLSVEGDFHCTSTVATFGTYHRGVEFRGVLDGAAFKEGVYLLISGSVKITRSVKGGVDVSAKVQELGI